MPPDPRSDPRAAAAAAAQRSGSSGSSSSSKDPRSSSSSSSKDPRASGSSSSSSKDPRADPRASGSSSSSSKDPRASSSSSGGSSSSSGSGGSSSSSSSSKPAVKTPEISANQWMSFFLFVCLCLIILQGPLGLTTPAVGNATGGPSWSEWLSFPSWGIGGGMPGCGAEVVLMPWCAGPAPVQPAMPALAPAPAPQAMGQMGGQGGFAMPGGGGGWSWYSHQPGHGQVQQAAPMAPPQQIINVQGAYPEYYAQPPPYPYAPPQQTNEGLCWYMPYLCQPLIPGAYAYSHPPPPPRKNYVRAANGMIYEQPDRIVQLAQKAPAYNYPYSNAYAHPYAHQPYQHAPAPAYAPPPEPIRQLRPVQPVRRVGSMPVVHKAPPAPALSPPNPPATAAESPGLANLENAFYPLLVGAIALLVVFDYAT